MNCLHYCYTVSYDCETDLDQDALDPAGVSSIVEESPHVVTQSVVLSKTLGQTIHTLLRSSYGDQIDDPGTGTPLSQTSDEETSLREANCMVTI